MQTGVSTGFSLSESYREEETPESANRLYRPADKPSVYQYDKRQRDGNRHTEQMEQHRRREIKIHAGAKDCCKDALREELMHSMEIT